MLEDCGIDGMLTYHLLNLGTNIQLVLLFSFAFILFFVVFQSRLIMVYELRRDLPSLQIIWVT